MTLGSQFGPSTLLAHLGEEDRPHGAVVPPLYQNSLFLFDQIEDLHRAFQTPEVAPPHVYSRISNPTVELAAMKIAALEGAETAKLVGSGMGAITMAVLSAVEAGSHVVSVDSAYKPLHNLLSKVLCRFGVTHTLVDGRNTQELLDAVRPETSLIYLESPSSFVMRLQDLEPIAQFARERGIRTIIDNTYATPLFCQPLKWGIDLVCHSATKYLGGHSDLTAGVICGSHQLIDPIVGNELDLMGSHLSPFAAWLLMRGIRTLKVRMEYHEESGNAVAEWLQRQPQVEVVNHLGLPDFPQREWRDKYLTGTPGLLSFEPHNQDPKAVAAFCNALKLFGRGVSWGGYESLVIALPISCSGFNEPRWVIRLSCGLEEVEDLVADLAAAMPLLNEA